MTVPSFCSEDASPGGKLPAAGVTCQAWSLQAHLAPRPPFSGSFSASQSTRPAPAPPVGGKEMCSCTRRARLPVARGAQLLSFLKMLSPGSPVLPPPLASPPQSPSLLSLVSGGRRLERKLRRTNALRRTSFPITPALTYRARTPAPTPAHLRVPAPGLPPSAVPLYDAQMVASPGGLVT